jgi:hypothetical protein
VRLAGAGAVAITASAFPVDADALGACMELRSARRHPRLRVCITAKARVLVDVGPAQAGCTRET